ncbi:hypothetical protein Zmor_022905 [Zophobas morio]|uniref:Uncharacterized protein n=1 Tax=Zophobas morio TaxID=2755281 RepID=A0AA38HX33_9CUCU|nr:hypothetical protein Zmor_022905 [Zophobas morio]
MLETTIEQLRSIQRDFISIQEATNTFLRWAKLELESKDIDADIHEYFTNVRRRYVKKNYEEKSIDEQPQSPEERFKISTFNVLMDIAVEAMNNRFLKNMDICRDMAILDPNNFEEICNKKSLPDNCMKYLSAKIIKYNSTATSSQLKEELLSFASNWEKLKLTLEDTYKTNYDLDLHIIEDDYDDEDGIDTMIFVVLTILGSILILYIYHHNYQKCLPGPWNLPIIGHLHKLDPVEPHFTLTQLAQKYGPVFRVKLGLTEIAVVSEAKLLRRILMKDETLSRPPFLLLDVMFRRKGLAYSPLKIWKDQRKFVSNFLKAAGAAKFSPNKKRLEDMIINYADNFVQYVHTHGNGASFNASDGLKYYVNSISGTLYLGKSFSRNDEYSRKLPQALDEVVDGAQLAGPLNFLPFLRFWPKYRKTFKVYSDAAQKCREIISTYINEYQMFSNDTSVYNLTEAFLQQRSKGASPEIYTVDQLVNLLFDVFTATTATTTSLKWIVLYLAQYQEVQDKIRQELLQVLGDRTPEMTDLPKLFYTQATLSEIARIRTIAPLGFPHLADEDVYIDDIKIPKGTTIMPLLWAIHMDPEVWNKPEEFRPGRFLNEDNKFRSSELLLPLQCGKRMCVGDELQRMITYLFVATVLKTFKIKPCESSSLDFSGVCGLSLVPKAEKVVFVKI